MNTTAEGEESIETNGAPQDDASADPMPRPRKWSRKSPYPRKSYSMFGNHVPRISSAMYDGVNLASERSPLRATRFATAGNGVGLLKKKHRALERGLQDLVRIERERLELEKQRLEMDRQLLLSMQTNMMWLSQALLIRTGMQMPMNAQQPDTTQSASSPPLAAANTSFTMPSENLKPPTD